MMIAKKLLIVAILCILQHFAYLTEISEDHRNHRIKRQCGCCSCYGGISPSSCSCSSFCPCVPGTTNTAAYGNNIGYGINGINFNAAYDGYGLNTYGQYPNAYGTNFNYGIGCGAGGGTSTSCGTGNIFPYNIGGSYGGGYGTGNMGYIYPQTTGCSTAFNTRCYCGTGYSPCNNGGLCCRNIGNGLMKR